MRTKIRQPVRHNCFVCLFVCLFGGFVVALGRVFAHSFVCLVVCLVPLSVCWFVGLFVWLFDFFCLLVCGFLAIATETLHYVHLWGSRTRLDLLGRTLLVRWHLHLRGHVDLLGRALLLREAVVFRGVLDLRGSLVGGRDLSA